MTHQGRRLVPSDRRRLLLGGILAAAVALRLLVIDSELWFDELWSLLTARGLGSPLEVFTAFRNDTNHHLVTLWMWLLGADRPWWAYRVPSLAAGLGSVLLAARIARRDSAAAAAWAAGLVGFSHLMVLYSTEARGYALACFFALLAYDRVEVFLRQGSWGAAAGFWAACAAGMLSSLTFAAAMIALALWSAAVLLDRDRSGRSLLRLCGLHGLPAAATAAWWWTYWRHLAVGQGPFRVGLPRALAEAGGYLLGVGAPRVLQTAAAVFAGLAVLAAIVGLAAKRDLRWVFFAAVVAAQPAIILLRDWQAFLFPRYFIVSVCFAYLLLAIHLGRWWEAGRARWLALALAAAWFGVNGHATWVLARDGRGHYREALRYMDEHSPGRRIVFGSMGDTRGGVLVDYYRRYLPPGRDPVMVAGREVMTTGPEWFLNHVIPLEQPGMPPLLQFRSVRYELEAQYPTHPLSGFRAGVYRRADLRAGARQAPAPGKP